MEEIWKDVKGYEGLYQVSNIGRVKSLPRWVTREGNGGFFIEGRMKKLTLKSGVGGGYLITTLSKNGVKTPFRVHRLVAEAFCEKPSGCDIVNHLDNNRANNVFTNLEWTTHLGNMQHSKNQGRNFIPEKGEACRFSVHSLEKVLEVRMLHKNFKGTVKDLSLQVGIPYTTVLSIVKGETWDFPEAWPV